MSLLRPLLVTFSPTTKLKKEESEIFAFCVIIFEPINIKSKDPLSISK